MNDKDATVVPAPLGPVERPVGRPAEQRTKADPLSYRQREVMKKAPDDWADLPSGMGCTNATLEALERRGLVEVRIEASRRLHLSGGWQWRKTPNAELSGPQRPARKDEDGTE